MKISYLSPSDQNSASFRYRILIPASKFKDDEVYVDSFLEKGSDIAVFCKHWAANIPNAQEARREGTIVVYDICDDHFEDHHRFEYKAMVNRADVITCNSESMRDRIKEKTGKDSIVIPDPYEMPLNEPSFNPGEVPNIVWFGHSTNLHTLEKTPLMGNLEIITSCEKPSKNGPVTWTPYTQRAVLEGIDKADMVFIPQDKPCKSANRVIESLRRGKLVIASKIPSYMEFAPYVYLCDELEDFREGVYWALENKDKVLEMITEGQKFIEKFSPEKIAKQWRDLFTEIHTKKLLT